MFSRTLWGSSLKNTCTAVALAFTVVLVFNSFQHLHFGNTVALVFCSCEQTCFQKRLLGKSLKNLSNTVTSNFFHQHMLVIKVSQCVFSYFMFSAFSFGHEVISMHAAGSRCGHLKMSTAKACISKTY